MKPILTCAGLVIGSAAYGQTVWGVKSPAPNGNLVSAAPAVLFRINAVDTSSYVVLDTLVHAGSPADVDGLAVLGDGRLVGWRLFADSSQYVEVDTTNGVLAALGTATSGVQVRGACADGQGELWAINVSDSTLIHVDPSDGTVITAVPITNGGAPWGSFGTTDITVVDGEYYVSNLSTLYRIDVTTGELFDVFTDAEPDTTDVLYTCSGNSPNAPPSMMGLATLQAGCGILTLDGNCEEDLYLYHGLTATGRSEVKHDVIGSFNSGGGDLAALAQQPCTTGMNDPAGQPQVRFVRDGRSLLVSGTRQTDTELVILDVLGRIVLRVGPVIDQGSLLVLPDPHARYFAVLYTSNKCWVEKL